MTSPKFSMPQVKSKYEPVEVGNHIARCISFVDLGTVTEDDKFNGGTREVRKVRITFEIPSLRTEPNDEGVSYPRVVSTMFNQSPHEKSNMYKFLSNWLGAEYTKAPHNFDPTKDILGKGCMVNVVHSTGEKTYANISAVTPLPKGVNCEEQEGRTVYFYMGQEGHKDEFDQEEFDMLPDFLKTKIEESYEYIAAHEEPKAAKEEKLKDEMIELVSKDTTVSTAIEDKSATEKAAMEAFDTK